MNAGLWEYKRIILSKLIYPALTILPSRSQMASGDSLVALHIHRRCLFFNSLAISLLLEDESERLAE